MRLFLSLFVFISFISGVVHAADNPLAVTVPVFTRHFPGSHPDLNERNRGLGFEYILREDVAVTAGFFNNSFREDTVYLGIAYTPFRVLGLHAGVIVGLDLSGGYNAVNPFKPVIGALRFTSGNAQPVGFNIDILPGGGNRNEDDVYGAAAVSLKYSF